MGKDYHSKSTGSLTRFCGSLVLTFAIITSSSATAGCSILPKANTPASTAPIAELTGIIPEPVEMKKTGSGYFEFSQSTKIVATNEAEKLAGGALNVLLEERYGSKPLIATDDKTTPNAITFTLDQSQAVDGEAYTIKIEPSSIVITGSERGMYYGCQSLLQLLPGGFNGATRLPAAFIRDAPRFKYRGMHLDVARHFMDAEFVKKFIRLISRYKYNYFHWHLTDDQGWRIAINDFPKLATIGDYRRETVLGKNYPQVFLPPDPYRGYVGDGQPVEGSYTQAQIRDVVAYARFHHVTIIPEIEMPGHASAALASYPALGCLDNYPYEVQRTWGAFPDIFCPSDATFDFINTVLDDVIKLFPDSPYIHIGGDEVFRMEQWTSSPKGKAIMKANGLADGKAVQRWFIEKVHKMATSKGKKIICWDDMMDAGIPPDATVMAWRMRGDRRGRTQRVTWDPGVEAVRKNHDVIMTPNRVTYFDHLQGAQDRGRLSIYNDIISLEDVYGFEPVPLGLSPEEPRILGAEGTLWTEFMETPSDVEHMMFPRAIALAEVLWSKREKKNLADFQRRLATERPKLDRERASNRGTSTFVGKIGAPVTRDRTVPGATAPRNSARTPAPRIPVLLGELNVPGLAGNKLPFTVVLPHDYQGGGRNYPVLYLLHGMGGNDINWWDKTQLGQQVASRPLIIVMPGVGDTWSPNSGGDVDGRYEDAIVNFLIPYIGKTYRAIPGREGRAVVGISTGGLGAIKLAFRYPREFTFAGSVSGAFDNNAFQLLEQTSNGSMLPWLYLSWGGRNPPPGVAESNVRFDRKLGEKSSRYNYYPKPYANDWSLSNKEIGDWNTEISEVLGQMCLLREIGCP